MELRPGRRLDMSSHFIPLPRSSIIKASSSGDHLLCFLAGDSDVCGGMLRFPPLPLPGRDADPAPPACAPRVPTGGPVKLLRAAGPTTPRCGEETWGPPAKGAGGGPPRDVAVAVEDETEAVGVW